APPDRLAAGRDAGAAAPRLDPGGRRGRRPARAVLPGQGGAGRGIRLGAARGVVADVERGRAGADLTGGAGLVGAPIRRAAHGGRPGRRRGCPPPRPGWSTRTTTSAGGSTWTRWGGTWDSTRRCGRGCC